jgi:hypothetical protein
METTARILPNDRARRKWRLSIEHWRDNVLTLEALVDEKRHVGDRAVEEFREAVRERDRAATHLARLVDWQEEEVQSIGATFGPELGGRMAEAMTQADV